MVNLNYHTTVKAYCFSFCVFFQIFSGLGPVPQKCRIMNGAIEQELLDSAYSPTPNQSIREK